MQQELRLHRIVLGSIAFALLCFVGLALRLGPTLGDERLEVIASIILIVYAAGALVFTGGVEGAVALQFGRRHKVESALYLALSVFSLFTGIYMGLSMSGSLQILAVIISPHAFAFGLLQLRMGQQLSRHVRFQRLFRINGMIELACGAALILASRLGNVQTANVIAAVGAISALQLLPVLLYPRSHARGQIAV